MTDWVTPVPGSIVTNGYKPPGHNGVDLGSATGSPLGAPIVAPRDGTVSYVSYGEPDAGNVININHADGWQTRYFHCDTIVVMVGQPVVQEQLIGTVGATGKVTGPHLHYEMRLPVGTPHDPTPFLNPYVPPVPPSPDWPTLLKREGMTVQCFDYKGGLNVPFVDSHGQMVQKAYNPGLQQWQSQVLSKDCLPGTDLAYQDGYQGNLHYVALHKDGTQIVHATYVVATAQFVVQVH